MSARGTFDICFYVVIDPDARRALWVRHTVRRGKDETGEAMSWAAAFSDAGPPLALKSIHPEDAVPFPFPEQITLGDTTFESTRARGTVVAAGRTITWELAFDEAHGTVQRSPRVLSRLPLPAHAEHVHARTKVAGFWEVDGERHVLGPRARMVQARIGGTSQPQEIFWLWAPSFDEPRDEGGLELVAARPRRAAWVPRVASLVLTAAGLSIDGTSVSRTARTRVKLVRPGVLEVRSHAGKRLLVTRAYAEPESFVGYVYRGPDGSCVYVAQSDIARCEVNVWRRHGLSLSLERVLCAHACAIEIHQPEPLPGFSYIRWEDTGPAARPSRSPALAAADASAVPLPAIEDVLAVGLSYADHVRETGSRAPESPIVFRKHLRSLRVARADASPMVVTPTSDEMLAALESIEPGVGALLRERWDVLPPLMDYEVELGLVLLEPVRAQDLANSSCAPRFAWFLANDLTARSCQILGEEQKDPYAYWAVAKSFPEFLPVSSVALPRGEASLDTLPDFELSTRVNGQLRQQARTTSLVYSPRQMLVAASRFLGGDLPAGLALLTGTPAGVGLHVPRWKKAIADVALDRFGKLRAAMSAHARGGTLLHAGDQVVCSATGLGDLRVTIG